MIDKDVIRNYVKGLLNKQPLLPPSDEKPPVVIKERAEGELRRLIAKKRKAL
jgi:hypothetical protein